MISVVEVLLTTCKFQYISWWCSCDIHSTGQQIRRADVRCRNGVRFITGIRQMGLKWMQIKSTALSWVLKHINLECPKILLFILWSPRFLLVSVKETGVRLGPNMTLEHHVEKIYSRLNWTHMFLYRTKKLLDFRSQIRGINSLSFPHLNYYLIIWVKCKITLFYGIQQCVNFTAKVSHDEYFTKRHHVTPMLNILGWLKINERLKLHKAIRVFNIKNRLSCPNSIVFRVF